jgi:hypothetical protein
MGKVKENYIGSRIHPNKNKGGSRILWQRGLTEEMPESAYFCI